MFIQIYLIFLSFLTHLSFSANTCYFPNGNPSSDVPCDADALFTQCCGSRSACLTNGLCILEASNDTGINYARGTCTDKTWSSPLCPQTCQLNQDTPKNSSAYDFRTNGVQVWQCGSQGYGEEAKCCCESEAERQRCCSTEKAVFTLAGAELGASTGAASTSAKATSATSSASLSVSGVRRSTFGPTATGSTVSESAPTSNSTTTSSATPQKTDNAKIVGMGAGVGGAVGLIVLIAVILCFVRRHNHQKKINQESQGPNISELHGMERNKQPVEVWTQPQELPSQAPPVWELSGDSKTPRVN